MGHLDTELVVAELHHGGDDGRILRLVSRVSDRHDLIAGLAGPVPLTELPTAHSDAAAARHSATATRRIIPAAATGASGLARLLPPQPYTSWAETVLDPLTPDHRHLLDVWLRTGTANAAAGALNLSPGTVRARLGHLTGLLGADLPDAAVRSRLLLALRAPTGTQDSPTPGLYVLGTLPAGSSTPRPPAPGPPAWSAAFSRTCGSPWPAGSGTTPRPPRPRPSCTSTAPP